MPRLIDADMLEPSEVYMDYGFTRIVYMDDIDEMPTIDAEPVRHGHWVSIGNTAFATCQCGYVTDRYMTYHYCPKCGAKMDNASNSPSPNPNPNEKSGRDTEE